MFEECYLILFLPHIGEDCVSLYQLNQHLDDNHREEEDIGERIMTWFRKTQRTAAKAMQTTAQKATLSFDRLDKAITGTISRGGFELNASGSSTPTSPTNLPSTPEQYESNGVLNLLSGPAVENPLGEEAVTRKHWQKGNIGTGMDYCSMPGCGKQLGIKVGNLVGAGRQNCRKCGKLYCDTHTSFQMRLAPEDARHDPAKGIWCRVCESCYCGKEGYRDIAGVSRHKTSSFLKHRKGFVDQLNLETNRIIKRFEKLSVLYAEDNATANKRSSISTMTTPGKRQIDQSVVAWEDDNAVTKCPFCSNSFFSFTNRRHHCRLCGRVMCGNDTCSGNIPLPPPVAASPRDTTLSPERLAVSPGDIKVCKNCRTLVKRRQATTVEEEFPAVLKLYQAINKNKGAVDELLPKFNSTIMLLKNADEIKADDREYVMASRYRKSLLDHFAEIEKLAKRAKMLPTESTSMRKLQDNIHVAMVHYLQNNMFTLHMMPRTTKELVFHEANGKIPLSADEQARLDAAKTALAAMETQEEQLRAFIEDATRRRKLEDVAMLKESLGEVVLEVDRLRREVDILLNH
ncbi:carboxypeptidase Y-deficient [Phlyctochytrium planicorne]|nr:carboxypeptidase Y-deficient [Phlyctochytrium planicorne]